MKGMDAVIPNVTKCLTWHDVKASHLAEGNQVVITLDKIYGMMIILVVGLIGATYIMIAECLVQQLWFKNASQSTRELGEFPYISNKILLLIICSEAPSISRSCR